MNDKMRRAARELEAEQKNPGKVWSTPLLSKLGTIEQITQGSGSASPTDPGVQPCCSGIP